MQYDDLNIKKILLEGNYIEESDIQKAEEYMADHRVSLIEYLLGEDIISRNILGQAIAESFGIAYVDLSIIHPSKENILTIPEDIAKKYRIVFLGEDKKVVKITTDSPVQEGLSNELQTIFPNKKISISYSMAYDIDYIFSNYHMGLETNFSKIIESQGKAAPEIVDQIFEDALLLKTSDIHFEPEEKEISIRFRIDGVLHDAGKIPKEFYENMVNRLKVKSKLRIDEHFSAQDGSLRHISSIYKDPVDLRISIIPTIDGEKVVIRILSSYVRDLTLSDIGLSDKLQQQIVKSAKKPFGMILVTGPTGSGKTTTLYSIIKILNTRGSNITTIEDPVEYKIKGVNQIQVNNQTNLTFDKGLRSIMRQDPNVILVGEIRDPETADVAVNAALTGHLLLSTFHANNAATAIPRFVEMGVEPFLVGSTIELIIAQRLARRICDSCKISQTLTKKDLALYDFDIAKYFDNKKIITYKGQGCNVCNNTGYKGRIGLFEYLTSSPELQDLIAKNPSTKDVMSLIGQQGFPTMFDDGMDKVKNGIISVDELIRVVGV